MLITNTRKTMLVCPNEVNPRSFLLNFWGSLYIIDDLK